VICACAKLGVVVLAALVIGLAACGGDDGDQNTAQAAANGNTRSGARDLDRFRMRNGEEPGFRPGAAPGARPSSVGTITGVRAFVEDMHLAPADARRLRGEGFVSFASQPIRGPRTAGISNVACSQPRKAPSTTWRTGCARTSSVRLTPSQTSALHRPGHSRCTRLDRLQAARRQPLVGAGSVRARPGNQGPGPFAGPLSRGARAIYERANGQCP
jgi:hypothetical protein